ncbi:MAG TPA: hypothetical protein VFV98_02125 [Vicinamibacterales bacterium]|nr:hypothetical protein [Vicinamibacterales bacterium]
MNAQRWPMLALVLSLIACSEAPTSSSLEAAARVSSQAGGDSGKCPLRAADLDKLTPYRWQFGQYKSNQPFIGGTGIRVDYCELIGKDDKGSMRTGVMVNIAVGANADAFAKHWRAVCADSIMHEARGKVQPVPGVPGGQQCVTAKGNSSYYWIESPGRTIQVEGEDDDAAWAKILPQLLAAAAR